MQGADIQSLSEASLRTAESRGGASRSAGTRGGRRRRNAGQISISRNRSFGCHVNGSRKRGRSGTPVPRRRGRHVACSANLERARQFSSTPEGWNPRVEHSQSPGCRLRFHLAGWVYGRVAGGIIDMDRWAASARGPGQGFPRRFQPFKIRAELRYPFLAAVLHQAFHRAQ